MDRLRIMARVSAQQFSGYCLWAVARRTRSKQQYKDATNLYGRSDTMAQAWGAIRNACAGLELEQIRIDPQRFSWRIARDVLRQDGEKPRFEGSTLWASVSAEERHALGAAGPAFRQALIDDEKRRQAENAWANRAWVEERLHEHHRGQSQAGYERMDFGHFALQFFKRVPLLATLGLRPEDDDRNVIKTAYRKLAMVHHPDRGGDAEQFKQIKAAYEALTA